MTKPGFPPLGKEFWDVNKRLLKISSSGRIYYTDEGAKEYRSLFMRHGYVLESVSTLADFRRVMRNIAAMQLEHSTEEILRLIHDPRTSQTERETLANIAGVIEGVTAGDVSVPVPRATAKVVSMADWRARR